MVKLRYILCKIVWLKKFKQKKNKQKLNDLVKFIIIYLNITNNWYLISDIKF
jgi:hypothetical protein